ncbi:MAG: O-antigen ligase family protein, partial [Thermodesulfovibrionia bacterium]|nr:O-antigen ligase family protein [Thermodesulfovibrionia bacterium]
AVLIPIYSKKDFIILRKKDVIIFSLLFVTGLLFAFSRAAILSLALILVYYFFKWVFHLRKIDINPILKYLAASVITISLLAIVFVDLKVDSFSASTPIKGLSTRMELWENASDLIKQKPITGWGPGSFKDTLKMTSSFTMHNNNTWTVLNTHNQFLETSGMFGLIVGIGLIWLLLFPTGFSRQHTIYSDYIIIAAIIFITAFFFESFLNRNLGILIFGLCYGLFIKTKAIYGS